MSPGNTIRTCPYPTRPAPILQNHRLGLPTHHSIRQYLSHGFFLVSIPVGQMLPRSHQVMWIQDLQDYHRCPESEMRVVPTQNWPLDWQLQCYIDVDTWLWTAVDECSLESLSVPQTCLPRDCSASETDCYPYPRRGDRRRRHGEQWIRGESPVRMPAWCSLERRNFPSVSGRMADFCPQHSDSNLVLQKSLCRVILYHSHLFGSRQVLMSTIGTYLNCYGLFWTS
ncbi:hypothetical protein C8R48DRAFT_704129 [Suillus tomentosus]|nr:hypothetical protein C8R48DRAFT_704129 [Suillus tomentosus]